MHEAATQIVGQEQEMAGYQAVKYSEEMAGYQTVKYSQDMATVIRQAVALHPACFSQFALVTIEFHFAAMHSRADVCEVTHRSSTRYLLNELRRQTGQNDLVWLKDTTCYFLLADANLESGDKVEHRLWKALVEGIRIMEERSLALPCAMTIGHSAYPEPSPTIEQCLNDALMACGVLRHDERRELPAMPKVDLSETARQLGVPYLSFLPRTFPSRIKRLVRPELARELHCFPLGCTRNTLTVAMSNPQDDRVLDRLKRETGMRIFPVLTHPDELSNALEHMIHIK